jgi:hypothetical protein
MPPSTSAVSFGGPTILRDCSALGHGSVLADLEHAVAHFNKVIPGSRFLRIPGPNIEITRSSEHLKLIDQPHQLAKAIRAFVRALAMTCPDLSIRDRPENQKASPGQRLMQCFRLVLDQEVGGSTPFAPTTFPLFSVDSRLSSGTAFKNRSPA